MSAVEKIKAAAAELSPDEQVEVFRWWVESDTFKQRQLAALKRDVAVGIEDLERGRYQTYTDTNVMQLAEDVGRTGRERLAKQVDSRKNESVRVSDAARVFCEIEPPQQYPQYIHCRDRRLR